MDRKGVPINSCHHHHPELIVVCLFFLWLLLASPVACHAPPRPTYYGRLHQQPNLVHSNRYTVDSSPAYSPRSSDRESLAVPSCGQLRSMWKTSVAQNWKQGPASHPNEIPRVFNPYYLNLLLDSNSKEGNHFGRIVNSPAEKERLKEEEETITPQGGLFEDYSIRESRPRESDPAFGKMVLSPVEARKKLPSGEFGRIIEDTSSKPSEISEVYGVEVTRPRVSQSSPSNSVSKSENGSRSSSSLTASEFFNAIWHDKPV